MRIYGYPPVADECSRVLILGSMPSVKSLETGFYYGHPQNAFWRLLCEYFGAKQPRSIAEKKRLLLDNGVALWDVIASCEREGSLDSAIRGQEINDFSAFFAAYPRIGAVLINGGTAHKLFPAALAGGRAIVRLPSTSPAYTLSYARKREKWFDALNLYRKEPI